MPRISFLQPKDPTGYRIDVEPPTKPRKVVERNRSLGLGWPHPGKTLLEGDGSKSTTWIVRNGGKPVYEHVRFEKEPIYKKLARTEPTPDGALAFTQKFGFLRSVGRRERVEDICNHIHTVRWLLDAAKHDEWDAIDLWLLEHLVSVNTEIGRDKTGRPQLQFQPARLSSAIYLQLLRDTTGGKESKLCKRPGCGEDFYYGPNTGRRSTAKYCSDGCRVKHFVERKEQSK